MVAKTAKIHAIFPANTLFYSEFPVLESFQLFANNNAVAYSGIILAHQALEECSV